MKFPTSKQRSYFKKYKCYICKTKASHMKFHNGKIYYLCDNDKCKLKGDIRIGFHSVITIKGKESEEQNG